MLSLRLFGISIFVLCCVYVLFPLKFTKVNHQFCDGQDKGNCQKEEGKETDKETESGAKSNKRSEDVIGEIRISKTEEIRKEDVCSAKTEGFREAQSGEDIEEKLSWWKTSILYQIYPRSFLDSSGTGVGDLRGIASKADYLEELGVGVVWLNPIFTSPMVDFGYDISNYFDIDPVFGDMEDFGFLLQEMHKRNIRVVLDFVPNHSSDQHEWFVRSVQREYPFTDFYVWADPKEFKETGDPIPPNNWLSMSRGSAWTWVDSRTQFYLHQYDAHQPDLNYRNPNVRQRIKEVLKFWLDLGVDGFRVDALNRLFEAFDISQDEPLSRNPEVSDPLNHKYLNHTLTRNQPEIFEVLQEWRNLVASYPEKILMTEVHGTLDEVMKYYGNETHPLADFSFNFELLRFRDRRQVTGFSLQEIVTNWLDHLPKGKWSNWVIGNHDIGRIGSRLGVDLIDAFNMMLLLLPGTVVTYYGEEIGMLDGTIPARDTQDSRGRDPGRTPMQWDNTTNAGFSSAEKTWLPVNENYETVNVAAQLVASQSHLRVYKQLASLRQHPTFIRGTITFPVITREIFSFLRSCWNEPSYLVVINTSEAAMTIDMKEKNNRLVDYASVWVRSVTDSASDTAHGSIVKLSNLRLEGGEGLVLKLLEDN